MSKKIVFATLGPEGTCHDYVLRNYLNYQGIVEIAEIKYFSDFNEGLALLEDGKANFVMQCSAHPEVHLFMEHDPENLPVVDTFIFPTKPLALLKRVDCENDKKVSLGFVPAAAGYIQDILDEFEVIVSYESKPLVGEALQNGEVMYGFTQEEYAHSPESNLEIVRKFGAVVSTWIIYGKTKRFAGKLLGNKITDYYLEDIKAR